MFSTYEAFKHPLQMERNSTVWSAVELTLISPLFLVSSVREEDASTRVFLLHGTQELLAFATQLPSGRLVGLQLLQPPRSSERKAWTVVTMREILFQRQPPDGSIATAAAVSQEGILYGGFPINVLEGDPGPLVPLASFTP